MRIQKLAITAIFAVGLALSATTASQAEDVPVEDCEVTATCEMMQSGIPQEIDLESPDCWVTEDGTDVCARGYDATEITVDAPEILYTEESCTISIDVDGNETTLCAIEDNLVDVPVMDNPVMYSNIEDKSLLFKNEVALSGTDAPNSNSMAALGILVGAIGAVSIGIHARRPSK